MLSRSLGGQVDFTLSSFKTLVGVILKFPFNLIKLFLLYPVQQTQNIVRSLKNPVCFSEAEKSTIIMNSIVNTINMVPLPYTNKNTSKYLTDKCQMREDLNGHSLIDFEMHDQTQI